MVEWIMVNTKRDLLCFEYDKETRSSPYHYKNSDLQGLLRTPQHKFRKDRLKTSPRLRESIFFKSPTRLPGEFLQ